MEDNNSRQGLSWKGRIQTAISCELVSIKLFGQDHGRPAEIGAIVVDSLSKGKLRG